MAGIELATAYVSIVPTARGMKAALDKEMGPARQVAATHGAKAGEGFMSGLGGKLKGIAGMLGLALGTGALVSFFKKGIESAEEYRRKQLLIAAAIRSTGGAAHVSSAYVDGLAAKLSKAAAVSKGTVLGIANLLLRFQAVKNVGVDKIFDRTTQAALDLSTATGREATGSVRMLGKALSDPVGSLSALSRAGVTFTQQQKDQITALAKSGDLLGAQGKILDGVSAKYGGAAAAVATPTARLRQSFISFRTSIGTALLPVIDRAATAFTQNLLPALKKIPEFVRSHWGLIAPIVSAVGQTFINLWHHIVNMWNALKPAVTLLAGAFIGALRVAATVAQTLSSALAAISHVLAGQAGIYSGIVLAVLGMWAAFKLYGIVSVAVRAIVTQFGLLGTRVGLAKLAISSFSLYAIGALALVGIAVGVATFLWSRHSDAVAKNKAFQAQQQAAYDALTEAIKADNGAIDENTRKVVAAALQKNGTLDAAKRVGVSLSLVTDAALGSGDAILQLSDIQNHAFANGGLPKDVEDDWHLLNGTILSTSDGVRSAVGDYNQLGEAVDSNGNKIQATTDKMAHQDQVAQSLKATLDELSGKAITEAQSELQLQGGLTGLINGIKDNGKSLTAVNKKTGMFTEGVQANRNALLSAIQTVNSHAEAVFDQTGDIGKATNAMKADEAMIRKAAQAAGLNTDQVNAMIKEYEAVPGEVKTTVNADTAPAVAAVAAAPATLARVGATLLPVGADTNPAESTLDSFLRDKNGKPLVIPLVLDDGELWARFKGIDDWIATHGIKMTFAGADTLSSISHNAAGGYLGDGWSVVGEHGRELVSPSGMVIPADRTARQLDGPGKGDVILYQTIQNPLPEPASVSGPASLRRAAYALTS